MRDPRGKCCASCRFWDRLDANKGACRRRAPVIQQVPDPEAGEGPFPLTVLSEWPYTHGQDWCGEWETEKGY